MIASTLQIVAPCHALRYLEPTRVLRHLGIIDERKAYLTFLEDIGRGDITAIQFLPITASSTYCKTPNRQ